jgi:hypothetical protein
MKPAETVSKEVAQKLAVDYLKKQKCTDKVDVNIVEKKREDWVIRGTCPINMEGHPWAEKFEVIVDPKGKIKASDFGLL